jgi:hypothetical protein
MPCADSPVVGHAPAPVRTGASLLVLLRFNSRIDVERSQVVLVRSDADVRNRGARARHEPRQPRRRGNRAWPRPLSLVLASAGHRRPYHARRHPIRDRALSPWHVLRPCRTTFVLDTLGKLYAHGHGISGYCLVCQPHRSSLLPLPLRQRCATRLAFAARPSARSSVRPSRAASA